MPKETIENMIENARPALSSDERSSLLRTIEEKVAMPTPVPSPYFAFIFSRTMPTLIIALMIVLGSAGTVAASDSAKPGDILFPIERATERVRLAFASDVREAELRSRFTNERLAELQEIIDEEATVVTEAIDDINTATSSATTTKAVQVFEAEVKVFTDITTVKVELNDRTARFVTTASTSEAVIDEIMERFAVDRVAVEEVLLFETKDRLSRPSERGIVTVSNRGEKRIRLAVNVFLDYLEDFEDGDERFALLTTFLSEIDNVSVAGRPAKNSEEKNINDRIHIDDSRVEISDEGYRIRIEDDGESKDRTENNSRKNSDSYSDDDERNQDRDRDFQDDYSNDGSLSSFKFEAEAKVFTDITIVKVEINSIKNEFETDSDTRDEVIDEIVLLYGLDRELVATALDFEVENRISRPTNIDSRKDKDKDKDKDEDEEDEEDED